MCSYVPKLFSVAVYVKHGVDCLGLKQHCCPFCCRKLVPSSDSIRLHNKLQLDFAGYLSLTVYCVCACICKKSIGCHSTSLVASDNWCKVSSNFIYLLDCFTPHKRVNIETSLPICKKDTMELRDRAHGTLTHTHTHPYWLQGEGEELSQDGG